MHDRDILKSIPAVVEKDKSLRKSWTDLCFVQRVIIFKIFRKTSSDIVNYTSTFRM